MICGCPCIDHVQVRRAFESRYTFYATIKHPAMLALGIVTGFLP